MDGLPPGRAQAGRPRAKLARRLAAEYLDDQPRLYDKPVMSRQSARHSSAFVRTVLPPSYLQARRRLASREIDLDWRKLGRKKPRSWPGMLWLWPPSQARLENAERGPRLDEKLSGKIFLIGTNTAGLLFAIDDHQRVVVIDEIEMDYPTLLARDFEAFERSFVLGDEKRKELAAREQSASQRGLGARWRKLDAIVEGRHALSRTANVYGILLDIADDYLLAEQREALLNALGAFVERHPDRKGVARKLRKYVKAWGSGGR
jgi:hypothetical protein